MATHKHMRPAPWVTIALIAASIALAPTVLGASFGSISAPAQGLQSSSIDIQQVTAVAAVDTSATVNTVRVIVDEDCRDMSVAAAQGALVGRLLGAGIPTIASFADCADDLTPYTTFSLLIKGDSVAAYAKEIMRGAAVLIGENTYTLRLSGESTTTEKSTTVTTENPTAVVTSTKKRTTTKNPTTTTTPITTKQPASTSSKKRTTRTRTKKSTTKPSSTTSKKRTRTRTSTTKTKTKAATTETTSSRTANKRTERPTKRATTTITSTSNTATESAQDNDWYSYDGYASYDYYYGYGDEVKTGDESQGGPIFVSRGGSNSKGDSNGSGAKDFFSAMAFMLGFGALAFAVMAVVRRRHNAMAGFTNAYGTFDGNGSAPALPPRDYEGSESEDDEEAALIPSVTRKSAIGWPLERPVPAARPDAAKRLSTSLSNSLLVEVSLDAPGAGSPAGATKTAPARKPVPVPREDPVDQRVAGGHESVEVPTGYSMFDELA